MTGKTLDFPEAPRAIHTPAMIRHPMCKLHSQASPPRGDHFHQRTARKHSPQMRQRNPHLSARHFRLIFCDKVLPPPYPPKRCHFHPRQATGRKEACRRVGTRAAHRNWMFVLPRETAPDAIPWNRPPRTPQGTEYRREEEDSPFSFLPRLFPCPSENERTARPCTWHGQGGIHQQKWPMPPQCLRTAYRQLPPHPPGSPARQVPEPAPSTCHPH